MHHRVTRTARARRRSGGQKGPSGAFLERGRVPDGAPEKAPCCKAGRFSYVDLYWENRHLVSGLPFLVLVYQGFECVYKMEAALYHENRS